MSLTNPTIHVPHQRVSVPSWVRRHLSWLLVGLAVLATAAVLAVTLADRDSGISPATPTMIERGSINAIDHRTAVGAGAATGASTPAGSLLHESISAVDHRTADPNG